MKDYSKHIWSNTGVTDNGTTTNFKCACGQTTSEHVHSWGDTVWDATAHWKPCKGCSEVSEWGVHVDGNNDGYCDYKDCIATGINNANMVYKQLVITGLNYPVVGNKMDFTISAAPSEFGNATVKWNRVVSLSQNTSTAMTADNVYAAGKMYNVGITFWLNSGAVLAEDFYVTLNGENVPVYKTEAAFNKAIKSYDGSADVSMAYMGISNGVEPYIVVCKMYAALPGECTHPNLDYNDIADWKYNTTHHYQECDICGSILHYVKHFDFNKNGTCDRCGYNPNMVTTSSGGTHTHSWSTDWVEDISNHWHQCSTCGAKKDLAAHADPNGNGKCDVCGFVMTAEAGHTHAFATTWTETAYQHYHLCSCGAKNDIGAHRDTNNSGLCDDCGYTMTAALNAAANGTVLSVGTSTGNTLIGGIPSTNDSNSLAATYLWMAAFAVSVLGLGGSVLAWRKRKES